MKAILLIAALAVIVAAGVFACPKKVMVPEAPVDAEPKEPEDASVEDRVLMEDVVIVSDGSRPD